MQLEFNQIEFWCPKNCVKKNGDIFSHIVKDYERKLKESVSKELIKQADKAISIMMGLYNPWDLTKFEKKILENSCREKSEKKRVSKVADMLEAFGMQCDERFTSFYELSASEGIL